MSDAPGPDPLQACADLLARGDPDRLAAAMARPVSERRLMLPLYAFNLEVARAPWVTQEAMIAEMRLQWWRDVLEEIAQGKEARAHEVAAPLAGVVTPQAVPVLDRLVEARRWEIYRDPFEDKDAFDAYLVATAGGLPAALCTMTGADVARSAISDWAWSTGLARLFMAIPGLEAGGRRPLLDGRPAAVQALAREGLGRLSGAQGLPAIARADGWLTRPVLKMAAQDPARVANGALGISPIQRNWRLMRLSWGML